ncbi:Glycosyl transferase family 2 [Bryocella elongata]|uniref:Glycosyl transferase family 2 n=2 Tax=Bryocella elongata TaxID=863522 RepID=A0A1H5YDL0_9BACT|nr:Glycosyl transferase family 2 [Bryocella elongata]
MPLAAKVRHAALWRWEFYAEPRWIRVRAYARWAVPRYRRPHGLPGTLILSLTSHRRRFPTLLPALRSLLAQTVRPDRTILWIARGDMEELPDEVRGLQRHGLEIRPAEDRGTYTKILPALDAFPEAYICIADDDVYYWPTWLEEMVAGVRTSVPATVCHRAHRILLENEGFAPYGSWPHQVEATGRSLDFFPTGIGGVLYPPGSLQHTAADLEAIGGRRFGDDLWLYWISRRNGFIPCKVSGKRQFDYIGDSQDAGLWREKNKGPKDEWILELGKRYGYPSVS